MRMTHKYATTADELNARLADRYPGLDLRVAPQFQRAVKPPPVWQKDLIERDLLKAGRALRWRGRLVDGHQRLEVCLRHGLPFEVEELRLPDRASVLAFIRGLHPSRRR